MNHSRVYGADDGNYKNQKTVNMVCARIYLKVNSSFCSNNTETSTRIGTTDSRMRFYPKEVRRKTQSNLCDIT